MSSRVYVFKEFVLNEKTSKPYYNFMTGEILCELTYKGSELVWAYVKLETLILSDIIDSSYVDELNVMFNCRAYNIRPIESHFEEIPKITIVSDSSKVMANDIADIEYIWSTRLPTCEDNAATIQFLKIINNEPYSKLSLNGSISKASDSIWKIIYIELRNAGFDVAPNFIEGGKICREMWIHLYNEFPGIEKEYRKTEKSEEDNQDFSEQFQVDKERAQKPSNNENAKG